MHSGDQPYPFFFILGRPRSGTTLLKTLFDAHPNVRIAPELPVFISLYQRFKNVKTWDEAAIHTFVDHVFNSGRFNLRSVENFGIDREKFTGDLLQMCGKATIQALLMKINEHSRSLYEKGELLLVGDKNPVYSVYMERLMRIFPDARFICIVRDFRDNYISLRNLKEMAMEAPVLPLQVARWRLITAKFLKYQMMYPERIYLIRYEDLVRYPEREFRQICEFTGIPFHAPVFDFHMKKEEFLRIFPDPRIYEIHKSLSNPVNESRIGLWKTCLTEEENVLAVRMAGEPALELDYVTERQSPGLKQRLMAFPWSIYARLLFFLMNAGSYMPYSISRRLSVGLLRLVKIYKYWKK